MRIAKILLISCVFVPTALLAQNWNQQSPAASPTARDGSAMVYDSLHHQTVLFGGEDSTGTVLNDTWVYDGTNWTKITPANSPGARLWHSMAFDAAHGTIVLFGGCQTNPCGTYLADTWLWNGVTWSHPIPQASPAGREAAAMTYAAPGSSSGVLLFGGLNSLSGVLADTWLWDGTNWNNEQPGPPGRFFASVSYDPINAVAIMFGGSNGTTLLNDTWSWNGIGWSQLFPKIKPPARDTQGQVYDPVRQATVIFGGAGLNDTWIWHGFDWTQETTLASPSARNYVNLAYDIQHGDTVLFGGQATGGDVNDTWTLGFVYSSGWMQLNAGPYTGPTARANMAATSDGTNVYLFGGVDGSGALYNDTWKWNGDSYPGFSSSPPPSARQLSAMAYSVSDGGVLLFGGAGAQGTPLGDTWVFYPYGFWEQFSPDVSPGARSGHSMVYDQLHKEVVLFGGSNGGVLNDTWTWQSITGGWNQANPANSPPGRSSAAMVYDGARLQTLLFGGVGTTTAAVMGDTWIWDGANWTQLNPATSPPARSGASMVYDSIHGTVLLFGGETANGPLNDMWQWDGVNWTQMNPSGGPSARYGAAAAFTQSTGQFFLFGGVGVASVGVASDTWIYASPYVIPTQLPTAFFGQTYNDPINPNGGVAPYTLTETGVPNSFSAVNLALNNGVVAGSNSLPPANSPIGVGVTVADSQGQSVIVPLTLISDNAITFAPAPPRDATAGTTYSYNLSATGGTPPFLYTISSSATWLTGSSGSSVISGTCPASTSSTFTFTAIDSVNGVVSAGPFTINCNPAPLIANPATLPIGYIGSFYNYQLTTNAVYDAPGAAPYTWSVPPNSLPPGLSLGSAGQITGSPTTVGTTTFTVTFTDAWSATTNKQFQITINPPLAITTAQLALGNIGIAYNQAIVATGGVPPYTFSATGLPNGLLFNTANGAITGTPTTANTFNANFTVTDSVNNSVSQTIPIFVVPAGSVTEDWVQLSPANAPTERFEASMFYDSVRAQTILFGGDNEIAIGGTFSWNGTNWTTLSPANSPSARYGAAVAFDPVHQVGVLFGGVDGTFVSQNDTWLWNGTTWTQATPANSPPARFLSMMAWDGTHIVLFGGDQGTGQNQNDVGDTWIWDGTNWTQIGASAPVPPPAPSAREAAGMAYDTVRNQVVLFGGSNVLQEQDFNDTWIWDGGNMTWTQASPATSPTARGYFSMAFDMVRGEAVMFGGFAQARENYLSDTWVWNGTTWAQLNTLHFPSARNYYSLAYDAARSDVVLFGGISPSGSTFFENDTWILDGPYISSGSLPIGTLGAPYSDTPPEFGGIAPLAFSDNQAQGFWLSLNPATGNFSGTPPATGVYPIVETVLDSYGIAGIANLSLTVNAALTLQPTTLPNATAGTNYHEQITAFGGVPAYTISATGLPAGLQLNANNQIVGLCTGSSASVMLMAIDSARAPNHFSVGPLTVTCNPAPAITTASPLANGVVGTAYSAAIQMTGGTAPIAWQLTPGTLPSGFQVSSTGVLTGPATAPFSAQFSVTVTDFWGATATKAFNLAVYPVLTITTSSLPNGVAGATYQNGVAIAATGGTGTGTYVFTATGLPGGFSINSATGAITGTTNVSAAYTPTFRVTDQDAQFATKQIGLTIQNNLTVSTTSLPGGTVGVSYGSALTASGGLGPLTWILASGSLPPGLNLDAQGGNIYGTPTTAESFSFSVEVSNSNGASPAQALSITIAPAPIPLTIVTAQQLASGTAGTAYSDTLMATGGSGQYTWTLTSGAPPGGLTLAASGAITGTPASSQIASFTATVNDTNGNSVSSGFTILVTSATSVGLLTPNPLPDGDVGVLYSYGIQVAGGLPPYYYSISSGQLPPGLTFDASTGILSGTPTVPGSFSIVVNVTDSSGATTTGQSRALSAKPLSASQATRNTVTSNYTIQIAGPGDFQITNPENLPFGTLGQSYSTAMAASGGAAPYKWQLLTGALPPGLVLTTAGSLTGTPTQIGLQSLVIKVTDSTGASVTGAFLLQIVSPNVPSIAALPPPASGTVGASYQTVLTAAGGHSPYTWSIATGPLPPGLSLNPQTGIIGGTPAQSGNFPFTAEVTDSKQVAITQSLAIRVNSLDLQIAPAAIPGATANVPYSFGLNVSGGAAPYNWSLSAGGLLTGFAINPASGEITGTPAVPGSFQFSISVVDSNFGVATQNYQFTVQSSSNAIAILPSSAPAATAGSPYSLSLSAQNGAAPLAWTVKSGTLPPGIQLNSANSVLSGTPTTAGSYTFTIQVIDATTATAQVTYTLVVNPQPFSITTTSLPGGAAGTGYSQTLQSAGATGAVTWSVTAGALPAGLSLGATTGIISGTPTASGTFTITVQAVSAGTTAKQQFTLTIAGPPAVPAITLSGLPATSKPGDQPSVTITLASPYSLPIQVTATLSITPNLGNTTDLMFANGSRTMQITIPANTTTTTLAFQTGTLPGAIQLSITLSASGVNVTPPTPLSVTTTIAAAVPVISKVSVSTTSTGIQVTVVGASTTLDMKTATFQFTPAAGATLQTTSLSVDVTSMFAAWYANPVSLATGSQFSLTMPFTISGNVSSIASVSVTLTNSAGGSAPMSANVP